MQLSATENKIVIGIDPDSDKHGAAVFINRKLDKLCKVSLWEVVEIVKNRIDIVFSIEDVMANQFVYARNRNGSTANQSKIAMHIGRCQQSQVELMRILDHFKVKYVLHKPSRQNWAKDKERFERFTGWDKQSNEDTRSAAYFGWLEASKNVSP